MTQNLYNCPMTKVAEKSVSPINNTNLKNVKPFRGGKNIVPGETLKTGQEVSKAEITEQAKALNATEVARANQLENPSEESTQSTAKEVSEKASSVAKAISKVPVLPIITPTGESKALSKSSEKKITDQRPEPPVHFIKKPAVIFIEGFSAFGVSNGDGIKDMADNYPGAKLFDWSEHDDILKEIKKHAPDQPVVLVGHSFGGDTAIEVAHELNSAKNQFRAIDLIVSIDAVGMNKTIIPVNVKSNLNYFGEGLIPFVHGDPTVARNTKYTEVTNELRTDLHSKMDDNPEVQFEIFNRINQAVGTSSDDEIVFEIDNDQLKEMLQSLIKK